MKKSIVCFVIVCITLLTFFGCGSTPRQTGEVVFVPNVDTVGVWWWARSTNINGPYLDFLARNGATEIYFSSSVFGQETSDFIARAFEKGIKVYWLQGDHTWIHDDSVFRDRYAQYLVYQANAPENRRFAGVHIDVEPHQDPLWRADRENRPMLLRKFLDFVMNLRRDFPNEHFDFDIPFWLSDDIEYRGQMVPLHQAIIREADRVFIMSYRDSAERIFNLRTVSDQIEFARSLGKPIFLSAESSNPPEGNTVISFRDRGKRAMYEELNKLKYMVNYENFGIAIHHARTWYNLKD